MTECTITVCDVDDKRIAFVDLDNGSEAQMFEVSRDADLISLEAAFRAALAPFIADEG